MFSLELIDFLNATQKSKSLMYHCSEDIVSHGYMLLLLFVRFVVV